MPEFTMSTIILIASIQFMPESPRWLMKVGKKAEARAVLTALKDLPDDADEVEGQVTAMEEALGDDHASAAASLRDLLKMGEVRLLYRFGICILLQFYQQTSGDNLISVYSTIIFQQGLGLDSQTARILSGGTLTWKFLSCFIAFFAIDR